MDKNQVQLQYGVSAKNKQWGDVNDVSIPSYTVYLNITVNQLWSVVATDKNTTSNPLVLTTANYTRNTFLLYGYRLNTNNQDALWGHWIAIGM